VLYLSSFLVLLRFQGPRSSSEPLPMEPIAAAPVPIQYNVGRHADGIDNPGIERPHACSRDSSGAILLLYAVTTAAEYFAPAP